MKLNIIVIIILLLVSVSFFFILKQGNGREEKYSIPDEIKEDRNELIDDIILKILGTRLSEFKLKKIADQTQGRNNFNYKYYLKDVIETLKSPNYNRFINQFLPEAKRVLNKKTWLGEHVFNIENLTELIRVIRVEEELQRQREQIEQEWEDAQAGGIVPQPFLPPEDIPIVPRPFLPPEFDEDEVFDPLPINAFD
jgi:hypothetical protein